MIKISNIQDITVNISITSLDAIWKGDTRKLPPNKTYELLIDYPLTYPAKFEIKTGKTGMDFLKLLKIIGEKYIEIYDAEPDSAYCDDDGSYGIWGHSIDDLCLEGLTINHKTKKIRLDIGS